MIAWVSSYVCISKHKAIAVDFPQRHAVTALLQPLAGAFRLGLSIRAASYRHGWLKTRQLSRPVISVGNLTLGGTGKTPLVAYIAESLLAERRRPGILTRGYGRSSGDRLITIEPRSDRRPDPGEVGDEAMLLARALPDVPIAVCADRYLGGRALEQHFDVDVHILDDGFQHWSLARDLDVVTLDITQDLSESAVLPAGRQREPCSAISRADSVVLTRAELADQGALDSFEAKVRRFNTRARIFVGSTVLCGVRSINDGETAPLHRFSGPDARPVLAFCGIGNPNAFFSGLRRWGFKVAGEQSYRDHHVYSVSELKFLQALAARHDATLVTTEKDALNLPHTGGYEIPLFACAIRLDITNAEAFKKTLLALLKNGGVLRG
jgi:tetraacyldisaccharide 4'-kinase